MAEVDACCTPESSPAVRAGKPALAERPLISGRQAADLVGLFKVLGNDTRLRLLHALHRGKEVPVGELADLVGMRPQAVSNQLQRLADRGIVAARRDGNRILYSIADACGNHVGCVAGCLTFREYRDHLLNTGFTDIEVTPTHSAQTQFTLPSCALPRPPPTPWPNPASNSGPTTGKPASIMRLMNERGQSSRQQSSEQRDGVSPSPAQRGVQHQTDQ
jgi:DNA-binding transcriptional ArsR family regulator